MKTGVEAFIDVARKREPGFEESVEVWAGMHPAPVGPKKADRRKQTIYFPQDHLDEMQVEADRRHCSLSQIVQTAWRISRETIKSYPSMVETT